MVTAGPDPQVRDFERRLDDALAARPTMRTGGTNAFRLAANIVDTADAEGTMQGHHLAHGLQILAPTLIGRIPGDEVDMADVVADLDFAGHYHSLRDLLYYTYNAPGSTTWTFDDGRVEIRYADASLPRQFFMSANTWFVDSMATFTDKQAGQRIEGLLRGTPEFELTPAALEATELIQAEVDLKLSRYFNLVFDVSVAAGSYTFGDFVAHVRARGISSRWAAWARAASCSSTACECAPPAVGVVSRVPWWQPDPAKCTRKGSGRRRVYRPVAA